MYSSAPRVNCLGIPTPERNVVLSQRLPGLRRRGVGGFLIESTELTRLAGRKGACNISNENRPRPGLSELDEE